MNETTRVIRIVVDSSKARSGSEESRRALKQMEDQVAQTRSSMDRLSTGWSNMMRGFAAVAVVVALVGTIKSFATGIAEAGDEIRQTTARFNVLTGAADGSRTALDTVYKVARNTGIGLKEAGDAFSRLAIAAGEFGATTEQIARVTDVVLKLGRVGGATAQEMNAGVLQLGQALASGRLQGDELRSILEGMPLVGKAIAKEFGVGLGELRRLGEEGKLVSDRVFKAMINAGADADAQFKKLPPTLEQAGNRGANAVKILFSAIDDTLGVSRLLAGGLEATADRAEKLAARIRGDINVALADTIAKIATLQAQADKVRTGRSRDMPNMPADLVPPVTMPGAPLAGPRRGFAGQTTLPMPQTVDAQLRALELERLRQSQIANSEADAENYERDRLYRQNQEKARSAADSRVRALEEKALTGAAKATRDYNQAAEKLRDDLDKGLITQDRYNKGLAAAKTVLAAASGGAKQTAESIKALNEATREADFAKLLADNAYGGAGRIAEIEAMAKAADKAIDALGKRDALLERRYADQLLSKGASDYLKDFRSETLEIERQNVLLDAQLRLVGARPEIAERELALLRVRLELEAKGKTISEQDLERRVDALAAQDKLNRQLEDGRRSAELWAEPFKNAIQSVQSTMTDFFEKLISGGIRSFGDLGAALKSIWFRLMAEMASVAVIRPVINFAVGGLGQLGILGPQTLQAFGISSGGGSSAGGGLSGATSGGGFNPFGLFGQGGLSGALGRVGSFLNTPFANLSMFGGPASMVGSTFGGLASSATGSIGGSLGGLGAGTSFLGGITPLQGLGALAGIGSGIFNLAQGNTVAGIGSLIGAGVSFIPGIGQIAGPIISIASSLLGGLFKSKPDIKAQGWHDYDPVSGRYTGRQTFAQGIAAPIAPGIGNDALKLISAFGGSVAPGALPPSYYIWAGKESKVFDATVTAEGSPTYARLLQEAFANGAPGIDQAQWAARKALWTDAGNVDLPIGDLTTDSDKLMQQLALLILKAGVRDNAFAGLSDTSQKIIRNFPDADTQGLASALQWGKETYDVLVRTDTITAAEKAITDLKDSFQAAILKAKEYGLATDALVTAQAKAINKYATDFGQNIEDQLLGLSDPAALQRVQVERARELALKEWEYLQSEFLKGNIDTLIERNKVQQLYDEKLKAITNQTFASLEAFERRVRFGDLSAANPLETLAGTLGAYEANTARALSGDSAAIQQYESFAQAALTQQIAYSGNDYGTAVLRTQILEEIAAIMGKAAGEPAVASDELLATLKELVRLQQETLDRLQTT